MQIHIRLAEPFWRPVGKRNLTLSITEGSRVSDLLAVLRQDYPALSAELDQSPPELECANAPVSGDLVTTM